MHDLAPAMQVEMKHCFHTFLRGSQSSKDSIYSFHSLTVCMRIIADVDSIRVSIFAESDTGTRGCRCKITGANSAVPAKLELQWNGNDNFIHLR